MKRKKVERQDGTEAFLQEQFGRLSKSFQNFGMCRTVHSCRSQCTSKCPLLLGYGRFQIIFKNYLKLHELCQRKLYVQNEFCFGKKFNITEKKLLRVALTGSSSHSRIYSETILSRISKTQVLERSPTVKCYEIFERTYFR